MSQRSVKASGGREPRANEPPEYDDAPPSWTDDDAKSPPAAENAASEADPPRSGRSGSLAAPRTSERAGGANPLALIEEVFPGKIMAFTAAPDPAGDGDSEDEPKRYQGDPAEPGLLLGEPEEADD